MVGIGIFAFLVIHIVLLTLLCQGIETTPGRRNVQVCTDIGGMLFTWLELHVMVFWLVWHYSSGPGGSISKLCLED